MAQSDLIEKDITVEQAEEAPLPMTEPQEHVAAEAIGTNNLPRGYFYSPQFLGTMLAVSLMNISLYVGYVLPVSR